MHEDTCLWGLAGPHADLEKLVASREHGYHAGEATSRNWRRWRLWRRLCWTWVISFKSFWQRHSVAGPVSLGHDPEVTRTAKFFGDSPPNSKQRPSAIWKNEKRKVDKNHQMQEPFLHLVIFEPKPYKTSVLGTSKIIKNHQVQGPWWFWSWACLGGWNHVLTHQGGLSGFGHMWTRGMIAGDLPRPIRARNCLSSTTNGSVFGGLTTHVTLDLHLETRFHWIVASWRDPCRRERRSL